MASNTTANFGLNLWDSEDTFSREEFNENSKKIDTAYGPSNSPWVIGSYVGATSSAGQTQDVNLGFRPSLLIIVGNASFGLAACNKGYTVHASTVNFENNTNISSSELALTTTGFRLTRFSTTGPSIAKLNTKYIYFALK